MTLCPDCNALHGPAIKAAATTLDVWRHGKSRSVAADELRAMLPPAPPLYATLTNNPEQGPTDRHNPDRPLASAYPEPEGTP